MKTRSKLLSLLLALTLMLSMFAGVGFAADDLEGALVILHVNDVHTRVDENIGYAGAAAAKKFYESKGAQVILLDAGDTLHGLPLANMTDGVSIVEILNATGIDAMTPGNHDFNFGTDQLIELAKLMDFPLLSANFTDKEGALVFEANTIIELDGYKVGIVGLTTPETRVKTTPAYVADYDFSDDTLAEVLQANIDELTENGADFIVCLGHLGIDNESSPWRSVDVIPLVSGLDVFIDGHSHSTIAAITEAGYATVDDKDGNAVILTSTGNYFQNIGLIIYDGEKITNAYVDMEGLEPDADVAALIAGMRAEEADELNAIVGNTPFRLEGERAFVRGQETNFGNLAADALCFVTGADVAFVNGGGIRVTLPIDHTNPESPDYVEGAVAGDITMKDILTVFPFYNTIAVIEISGETLLDALEHGTSQAPNGLLGGFPQVSGLTFTLRSYLPYVERTTDRLVISDGRSGFTTVNLLRPELSAEERRVTDVLVNGEPLDLTKTYTLACNNFMATGGDGYIMFENRPYISEHGLDYEPLLDYIVADMDGVVSDDYATTADRINIVRFSDVAPDVAYFDVVDTAAAKGYMIGLDDGSFAPDVKINRAMAVTLLYRLAGKPEVEEGSKASDYFSDVEDDAWYSTALVWAVQNGVCSDEEDEFDLYGTLNVGQLEELLVGFGEATEQEYGKWFADAPAEDEVTRAGMAYVIADDSWR